MVRRREEEIGRDEEKSGYGGRRSNLEKGELKKKNG